MEEEVIINAIIKKTILDIGDRGFLQGWLMLEYDGGGQGFGGYALYLPKKDFKNGQIDNGHAGHFIYSCMNIAGVGEWSQLPGKTIRVKKKGFFGDIIAIGHIVKNIWFNPKEDFGG